MEKLRDMCVLKQQDFHRMHKAGVTQYWGEGAKYYELPEEAVNPDDFRDYDGKMMGFAQMKNYLINHMVQAISKNRKKKTKKITEGITNLLMIQRIILKTVKQA